jgi:hypothetical protein
VIIHGFNNSTTSRSPSLVRPFQFQGIFVYFMTYNSHGNRSNFFAKFGRIWNIPGIFLSIFEILLFLSGGVAIFISSTLYALQIYALRSPLYAHIQVSSTILITTDPNWYHNLHPHERPFPDLHIITHFIADTITYDEPTIPPELQIEPGTKKCGIRILCIHHKTTPINPIGYIGRIHNIGTSSHIPDIFTTTAPPTPTNTPVNQSKKWSQLTYPPPSPLTQLQPNNIPPITNHDICLPPKYPPQFC